MSARKEVSNRLIHLFAAEEGFTRRVIDFPTIKKLFPDYWSSGSHCIQGGDEARLWRLFVPASIAADDQTWNHIKQTCARIQKLPKDDAFRQQVRKGKFGIAVLFSDSKRAAGFQNLMTTSPLPKRIHTCIAIFDL